MCEMHWARLPALDTEESSLVVKFVNMIGELDPEKRHIEVYLDWSVFNHSVPEKNRSEPSTQLIFPGNKDL